MELLENGFELSLGKMSLDNLSEDKAAKKLERAVWEALKARLHPAKWAMLREVVVTPDGDGGFSISLGYEPDREELKSTELENVEYE